VSVTELIDSAFPEYANLANPDPVPVEDAQQLLHEDEALIQFLIGSYGSYVWAITKSDVRWVQLAAGRREIVNKVDALRCGLDARTWYDYGGSQCQRLLQTGYTSNDYERGAPLPFDLAKAHELYRDLFGGIEDLIHDKRLLVIPSGPSTKLPLHVLVTAQPPTGDQGVAVDYSAAQWLARRQPMTIVPSVAALKALRSGASTKPPTRPFIGFGNPLLSGPDGQNRRAWQFQSCRREPSISFGQRLASAMQYVPALASLFRGSLADVRELRRQMPLPETADELCTIAHRLRAIERNLKHISATGELAKYGVLHFATHGLVAGDLAGLTEPALVLTPPNETSEEDDGLLTASEVAELELAADWVVLSACNTAAGQGGDAEALSGLARAFFHAGARALLVSHWEVNSYAAVKLSTAAFAALADNRASGRAEAIRQAMLSMIESGNPAEAHPSNWAPFVVVGEGSDR
jgi:CHAT domain-containing protein